MNYPNGELIKLGDVVWWNEGTCVGLVSLVVESSEEMSQWGLEESGIFISNDVFGGVRSCDVFNAEAHLVDEGVAKLTPRELTDMNNAFAEHNLKVEFSKHNPILVRVRNSTDEKICWLFIPKKLGQP